MEKDEPPAGLEPAIPGLGGRCLIHWATEAITGLPRKSWPHVWSESFTGQNVLFTSVLRMKHILSLQTIPDRVA